MATPWGDRWRERMIESVRVNKRESATMRTRHTAIISLILCLVSMRAQAGLVNSNGSTPTCDGQTVLARCGYDLQIEVAPFPPTEDDAILVTSSGWWSTGCVPEYQSHQVVSNVIGIDFVYDPFVACPQMISPWGHTVGVGTLPSGIYEVNVYINSVRCGSKSFVVFEEFRQVYLPAIARQSAGLE
jgi:hypothetical protein